MKPLDRRHFMRRVAGAGSAALLGLSLGGQLSAQEQATATPGKVLTRVLGRTGIRIPVVSMGVMNADNPELVRQAHIIGMRHFDTAWYYQRGNNERMVGRVLKELAVKRDEVCVATKILINEDPRRQAAGKELKALFIKRFRESLSRLQMDYVDILYHHAVERTEQALDPHILEAMQELKGEGRLRFTGISSHVFWPDLLTAVADHGFHDVALVTFNYSMHGDRRQIDALNHARSKGMGLVAMKTQCQQAWYRDMLPGEMKRFYEGKVMHTALLKWVLRHEQFATAVPGFMTFQQMEEDFGVATSLEYTPEERGFLEERQVQLALEGNCQLCGQCLASCPSGADIPNLMRTHMYATCYGNAHKARETLSAIEPSKNLSLCTACPECTARCVRKVDIAGRIGELREIYV